MVIVGQVSIGRWTNQMSSKSSAHNIRKSRIMKALTFGLLFCSSVAALFSTTDVQSPMVNLGLLDGLTYKVSTDVYSLLADGGAASGGVVSEGQAYAMLISAIVMAQDLTHEEWETARDSFEAYFNGWKRMCENSKNGSCQSTNYCEG